MGLTWESFLLKTEHIATLNKIGSCWKIRVLSGGSRDIGKMPEHLPQIPSSSHQTIGYSPGNSYSFDVKLYLLTKFLLINQLQVNTWSSELLRPVLLALDVVFGVIQQL